MSKVVVDISVPLNARLDGNHVELETLEVVKTPAAVHTRYGVVR